jgi:hypothetical protein
MHLPHPPVGKITPIVVFVILPVVIIIPALIVDYVIVSPSTPIVLIGLFIYLINLIGIFYYLLARPRYIEKCLKQGLERAVIEFETIKKIIPITLLLVLFVVIPYTFFPPQPVSVGLGPNVTGNSVWAFWGIAILLTYCRIILRKEFRIYLAKTCFTTALDKGDTFKQMRYFDMGLQEYNKYLKRYLKHQVKDIDKVFSKVSLLDNDAKNEVICTLSNSFKTETETDKLKPLKCISSELMKSEDIESVLIPESLKSQLKTVGAFLAAAIPIVISIISLLLPKTP